MPFFYGKTNAFMLEDDNTEKVVDAKITEAKNDPIVALVEAMRTVKINNPDAELNATTISDGNGGRILL